jgi:predicted small lipoprotein YifL
MKALASMVAAALLLSLAACGSSPAAPAANPIVDPPAAIAPTVVNLTGTWIGTGTDAQGPEKFTWTMTQAGDRLTGSVVLDPGDPNDGSCGSCHKQKHGTLAGALSNGALTLTLDFPEGGADITPLCGITMHAATSDIAAGRITASYTGTTTCEGPIADGKLTVVR